jgi:hypothetical protein
MAFIRWLLKSSEASSKPDYKSQGYLAFSLKVKKNRSIGYALLHTIYVVFHDVTTILGIGFLRADEDRYRAPIASLYTCSSCNTAC